MAICVETPDLATTIREAFSEKNIEAALMNKYSAETLKRLEGLDIARRLRRINQYCPKKRQFGQK